MARDGEDREDGEGGEAGATRSEEWRRRINGEVPEGGSVIASDEGRGMGIDEGAIEGHGELLETVRSEMKVLAMWEAE